LHCLYSQLRCIRTFRKMFSCLRRSDRRESDGMGHVLLVGCHCSVKSTFSMFLNTWSECTGDHRSNSRRLQWRSNTLQNNTRSCAEHYCVAFFSVRCGNKMLYIFNMTISKIVISWKFLPIQFCAMQYRLPNNSVVEKWPASWKKLGIFVLHQIALYSSIAWYKNVCW